MPPNATANTPTRLDTTDVGFIKANSVYLVNNTNGLVWTRGGFITAPLPSQAEMEQGVPLLPGASIVIGKPVGTDSAFLMPTTNNSTGKFFLMPVQQE